MTHKEKILSLLSDKQKHTFRELNNICFRYGGRIFDLRKDGYVIGEERDKDGVWWYWLEKEPSFKDVFGCTVKESYNRLKQLNLI